MAVGRPLAIAASATLVLAIAGCGASREAAKAQASLQSASRTALGPVSLGIPNVPELMSADIPGACPLVAAAGGNSFYVVMCGERREATEMRRDGNTIWIATSSTSPGGEGAAAVGIMTSTTITIPPGVDLDMEITVVVDGAARTLKVNRPASTT